VNVNRAKILWILTAGALLGLAVACVPTELPPVTVASPTPSSLTVQLFFIALEDNGKSGEKIGCDDSVVPVQVTVPYDGNALKAALQALLSVEERYYGQSGLYNALYQSSLQVQDATSRDGQVIVNLTGTLMLGGVCDNPRVAAQIEETALQFGANEVYVFVNGKPLQNLLSLKE
jgi:hypothetical protein